MRSRASSSICLIWAIGDCFGGGRFGFVMVAMFTGWCSFKRFKIVKTELMLDTWLCEQCFHRCLHARVCVL